MGKNAAILLVMLAVIAALITVAFTGADLLIFEIPSVQNGIVPGLDLSGGSIITYSYEGELDKDRFAQVAQDLTVANVSARERRDGAQTSVGAQARARGLNNSVSGTRAAEAALKSAEEEVAKADANAVRAAAAVREFARTNGKAWADVARDLNALERDMRGAMVNMQPGN